MPIVTPTTSRLRRRRPTSCASTGSFYEYDGLGRRVRINQTSGQPYPRDFQFVWDGLKPVRALGMLEDIPLEVVYYDQGMFILLDNEPYHYIYTQKDHLGSNRNGYAYDAYGNLTDWDNEAPPWFERLYTGHLYDASAGLYLAPYRSYDPELGRWLSREPLGLDGPNLYHYVFNDPVNAIDPTGLLAVFLGGSGEITFGAGGSVGTGIVLDFSSPGRSGFYSTAGINAGLHAGANFVFGISPGEFSGFGQGVSVSTPGIGFGGGANWNNCGEYTQYYATFGIGTGGASYSASSTGVLTFNTIIDTVGYKIGYHLPSWLTSGTRPLERKIGRMLPNWLFSSWDYGSI